jgi:hypothetical protein
LPIYRASPQPRKGQYKHDRCYTKTERTIIIYNRAKGRGSLLPFSTSTLKSTAAITTTTSGSAPGIQQGFSQRSRNLPVTTNHSFFLLITMFSHLIMSARVPTTTVPSKDCPFRQPVHYTATFSKCTSQIVVGCYRPRRWNSIFPGTGRCSCIRDLGWSYVDTSVPPRKTTTLVVGSCVGPPHRFVDHNYSFIHVRGVKRRSECPRFYHNITRHRLVRITRLALSEKCPASMAGMDKTRSVENTVAQGIYVWRRDGLASNAPENKQSRFWYCSLRCMAPG